MLSKWIRRPADAHLPQNSGSPLPFDIDPTWCGWSPTVVKHLQINYWQHVGCRPDVSTGAGDRHRVLWKGGPEKSTLPFRRIHLWNHFEDRWPLLSRSLPHKIPPLPDRSEIEIRPTTGVCPHIRHPSSTRQKGGSLFERWDHRESGECDGVRIGGNLFLAHAWERSTHNSAFHVHPLPVISLARSESPTIRE